MSRLGHVCIFTYLHSSQVHADKTGGIECLIQDTRGKRERESPNEKEKAGSHNEKTKERKREGGVAIDGTGWRVC